MADRIKHYSGWLGNLVTFYLRSLPHRGQLRVIGFFEKMTGNRLWNIPTKHGFRLLLDRRDLVQSAIIHNGDWDPEVVGALSERWTAEDIFFDIGANIGFFSFLAHKCGLKEVIAFEPFERLADCIDRNRSLNHVDQSRFRIERTALGNSNQAMNYVPGALENSGAGKLSEAPSESSVSVSVQTLDSFLNDSDSPHPTIMKLDVEGFERQVLEGARNLLATNPPHTIVFEADCDDAFKIEDTALERLLVEAGYQVHHLKREVSESKENFIATIG